MEEALERSGGSWADLARACNVSSAAVSGWSTGKTKEISGEPLVKAARFLNVSEAWLLGLSPTRSLVANLALVTDKAQSDDVLVPHYQNVAVAAGSGVENSIAEPAPPDYATFKRSWLVRKGLDPSALVVICARGDSMADRVQDGDVVLVDTREKSVVDGKVFAFVYDGVARLKRLKKRINGNVSLLSDNDPNGSLREDVSIDTINQLHIIGRAVWVGGNLL